MAGSVRLEPALAMADASKRVSWVYGRNCRCVCGVCGWVGPESVLWLWRCRVCHLCLEWRPPRQSTKLAHTATMHQCCANSTYRSPTISKMLKQTATQKTGSTTKRFKPYQHPCLPERLQEHHTAPLVAGVPMVKHEGATVEGALADTPYYVLCVYCLCAV